MGGEAKQIEPFLTPKNQLLIERIRDHPVIRDLVTIL